jgi:glycosyltransferase involved in cell wall biosynthesis
VSSSCDDRVPKVSIGLPVYNGEPYLAEALDSILSQTFTDFEVVIGDNASTDGTATTCRRFAMADTRIRYVRYRANYGYVFNFNSVFRLSRGEYFKWAAADDLCAPDFLLRCVELLDSDSSIVLVSPRQAAVDEERKPTTAQMLPGPGFSPFEYGTYTNTEGALSAASPDPVLRFHRVMRDLWFTDQLYGLIRTSALSRTRLHAYHHMGDHILLAELALLGRFIETSELLFFRRIHRGQSNVGKSLRQLVRQATRDPTVDVSSLRLAWAYVTRLQLHLSSVRRAPLRPDQKARCYAAVGEAMARWGWMRAKQVPERMVRRPPAPRR